ncbi:hypothetical protein GCM10027429_00210 [Marivirga atlantica]
MWSTPYLWHCTKSLQIANLNKALGFRVAIILTLTYGTWKRPKQVFFNKPIFKDISNWQYLSVALFW